MSNIRYIDKTKCTYLGDNIWYDRTTDIFYLYDDNQKTYIEVECDNVSKDKEED